MVRDASDGASTTWLRRNAGVARLDAVLILACAVMLLPFVWMILTSLKLAGYHPGPAVNLAEPMAMV
jgi:hypothetical protein